MVTGNLLDAASFEPIEQRNVVVPAHGSRELPLEFGSVEAGSIVLITDQHDDLKATIGGVAFREGDLFDVPAYFLILLRPGDATLLLENRSAEQASVGIQLLAKTSRKIEVDVEPTAIEPGGTVTFKATVSEPTADDVVHVVIVRDHVRVAALEPQRVNASTWRMSYEAPAEGGFYAVTARVDGGPPRQMSGITGFEVAHRGTRIDGFDELTRDVDGDGLIDWLVVRLHFTVSTSGTYLLMAALTDSAGTSLPVGGGSGDVLKLRPGKHVEELRWSGASIRATATAGPYGIAHVQLTRVEPSFRTEADIAKLGKTRAYEPSDFDPDQP